MQECDAGKVTSPAECEGDGTDVRQTCVAARLANLEALVTVDPDTFITVRPIWLTYDLLKVRLQR